MAFLEKLIVILSRRESYVKIDRYKSKKVDDISQSQKVGLVCR